MSFCFLRIWLPIPWGLALDSRPKAPILDRLLTARPCPSRERRTSSEKRFAPGAKRAAEALLRFASPRDSGAQTDQNKVMIRLLVLSDLHLKHRRSWSLPDGPLDFDVAIFAGDIAGSPREAVDILLTQPALAERPIVYVSGNREFHGGEIEARLSEGRAAAVGTRVNMLDRETVVINGARFIGAVLWTDYGFFPGIRDEAMIHASKSLEDRRAIRIRDGARSPAFTPSDALARHEADLAYIESELARPFAGPTVVVTHHAPHRKSVAFEHLDNMLTAAYVSDLSATIERGKPRLWAHGHTHRSFDYEVGGCRIVCNPEGHGLGDHGPEKENPQFNERLVIEV